MPIYVKKILGANGKKFNATAASVLPGTIESESTVINDPNTGMKMQIWRSLVRYFNPRTNQWGDWQINPKFENNFTGPSIFNATAASVLPGTIESESTVINDPNTGMKMQIWRSLVRYFNPRTNQWGDWQINPKFENNFTGPSIFNATAASVLPGTIESESTVLNDPNTGTKMQVWRNLVRYFNTRTNQWGDWQLNPKFENNFTGDTGHTLDWQIGMEDPPYYGLFGSKKKKEASAVADAMRDARAQYPVPTSCNNITQIMDGIRSSMEGTQHLIDTGESPNVAPRYLAAYNTILQEYIAFYNANCVAKTELPPAIVTPPIGTGGPSVNQDPIVKTALPNVNTPPSQTGTINNTANAIPVSNSNVLGATVATPENSSATASKKMEIPKWTIFAAGGVVLLTAIFLFVKKK